MTAFRTLVCLSVALVVGPLAADADDIVANDHFAVGGYSYADYWRPLPGQFRMLRRAEPSGRHSLYLQLRDEGDGGVIQTIELPPRRTLSLRMLATCWANGDDRVIASLVRVGDGVVLAEVVVDGIERGELAANFESGPGGPAELMVRLVGHKGARCSIEYVTVGPPVATDKVGGPVFAPHQDLVLAPGEGLRVDADFTPRLLPAAAQMLQEAMEDLSSRPVQRVAARASISVAQPESADWPARESYHLTVAKGGINIEAPAETGAFWAMMTVIDLLRREPDGGIRILAVDVEDRPALPWRIGSDDRLGEPSHCRTAARALARLKLNLALVEYEGTGEHRGDAAAVAALRAVGLEPVLIISADCPLPVDAALADARARLGARCFVVDPGGDGETMPPDGLDWSEPALRAVRAAAGEVTVIVPAFAITGDRDNGGHRFEALSPEALDDWPREVVVCLLPPTHSEQAAQAVAVAEAKRLRYVIFDERGLEGAAAAVRCRERNTNCLGVMITQGDELRQKAADLAWGGLSVSTL